YNRISPDTKRPTDHEFSWRIERRGRAFPDEHESKHAPKRNRRSDRYHDHARHLRRSGSCGFSNSRPRQEPSGQIHQHKANKKRSVSDRTDKNEHGYRCGASKMTGSELVSTSWFSITNCVANVRICRNPQHSTFIS